MKEKKVSGTIPPSRVFLVGPRYHHHSGHSGYEAFGQYCATYLESPVRNRFLAHKLGTWKPIGDIGWRLDDTLTKMTSRPLYSVGILAIELATGMHMLNHENSVYHVLYGDTDVWLMRHFRRMNSNKLVASFHEPPDSLKWLEADKISRELDGIVLVSECQRVFFENLVPRERIFVVPHGVDTRFFTPPAELSREPIIVTVGAHLRDFDTYTRAIDLVLAQRPDARFVAVGVQRKGGGNFQLNDPRVEYRDGISDEELRDVYRSGAVGAFSLYHATANNAILEAMACGLPIVAHDVGGIREFVPENGGFLAQQYVPEEFANAILRMLNERELALSMSAACRAAAESFDYEIIGMRMAEVYTTVANA